MCLTDNVLFKRQCQRKQGITLNPSWFNLHFSKYGAVFILVSNKEISGESKVLLSSTLDKMLPNISL